jgi:hypothetical protein
MAVNQIPSKHAFAFTVTDTAGVEHKLWWDLVQSVYFAWETGVFLIHLDDGVYKRIAAADLYPESQAPEGRYVKLVNDCRSTFNEKISSMFLTAELGEHPVDDEAFDALVTGLVWDPEAQQFK